MRTDTLRRTSWALSLLAGVAGAAVACSAESVADAPGAVSNGGTAATDAGTGAVSSGGTAATDAGTGTLDAGEAGAEPDGAAGKCTYPAQYFGANDPDPCGGGTVFDMLTQRLVEGYELQLHAQVDPYMTGERAIYAGTANARNNMGYSYSGQGVLSGDVRLLLRPKCLALCDEPAPMLDGVHHELFILAAARDELVYLEQDYSEPPTTTVFQVSPWNTCGYCGYSGTTLSIPALKPAPASISFVAQVTEPLTWLSGNHDFVMDLELNANRIPPGVLTVEDVQAVANPDYVEPLKGFVLDPQSGDYVLDFPDNIQLFSCVPAGSGFQPMECTYYASFVVRETLARDLSWLRVEISTMEAYLQCYHCDRSVGSFETFECVEGERCLMIP